MKARLFVCTTCDRYAAAQDGPTRGEVMLAAVQDEAERRGAVGLVHAVSCVNSCPRPSGAAVREGRGGGVFRFARLSPADAPALVDFVLRRSSGEAAEVPPDLTLRVASYIMPRPPITEADDNTA
jgi:predicted metal-binding protein